MLILPMINNRPTHPPEHIPAKASKDRKSRKFLNRTILARQTRRVPRSSRISFHFLLSFLFLLSFSRPPGGDARTPETLHTFNKERIALIQEIGIRSAIEVEPLLAVGRLAVNPVDEQVRRITLSTEAQRLGDIVAECKVLDLLEAALLALDDLEDPVRSRISQCETPPDTHQRKRDKPERQCSDHKIQRLANRTSAHLDQTHQRVEPDKDE